MSFSAFEWIDPITGKLSEFDRLGAKFPLLDGIPVLTQAPAETVVAFQAMSQMTIDGLDSELKDLSANIDKVASQSGPEAAPTNAPIPLVAAVQMRIERRLKAKADLLTQHRKFLEDVLKPILSRPTASRPTASSTAASQWMGFHFESSLGQSVFRYTPSLIRDWSGLYESENTTMWRALEGLLHDTKVAIDQSARVLFLGSGGSRLAVDFCQRFPESAVAAVDLSPLMLLSAKRILNGESLTAVDFARSPLDSAHVGRTVTLKRAPAELGGRGGAPQRLCFALADTHQLPFANESIDLVVTPWLIDIVNRPFADLGSEISRVLKSDGHWLNLGTLRPHFYDELWNHGQDEIVAIAEVLGLQSLEPQLSESSKRPVVSYLNSDLDAHKRTETLTGLAFQKKRSAAQASELPSWLRASEPEWLKTSNRPVPSSHRLHSDAVAQSVQAFTLALVDGKRSIDDIAGQVASAFGLSSSDAKAATAHFFKRYFAQGLKRSV